MNIQKIPQYNSVLFFTSKGVIIGYSKDVKVSYDDYDIKGAITLDEYLDYTFYANSFNGS